MISATLEGHLANARSITVLTGAGVSAESGVPTFRDKGGLWTKFKPEELANFQAFIANPNLVWEWYSHRRKIIQEVQPNPGHFALVELESLVPDFTLITQNVDNLHRRAGSLRILELHGNIERSYCIDCREPYEHSPDVKSVVPRCQCGGLVRPDVVWFGEYLPEREMSLAWKAAERSELFFSIGTSGEVYPAAQLPGVAREKGAYVVEINPNPSVLAPIMHECLMGTSASILPQLVTIARRHRCTA